LLQLEELWKATPCRHACRISPRIWNAFSLTSPGRFLNRGVRDRFVTGGLPFIGVTSHQHILPSLEFLSGRKAVFMSSRSRDGELSTRFLRRMGHGVVRGSSSAGGAGALREMPRLLEPGLGAIMAADGPKGPARVAKTGCVAAVRDAGVPLIPIGWRRLRRGEAPQLGPDRHSPPLRVPRHRVRKPHPGPREGHP
jgi:hypothetical protein